jgi:hypothetical protein
MKMIFITIKKMNKMKNWMTLGLGLIAITTAFAQPDKRHNMSKDEMQAKKVSFIANELELNTEEAQKFWPVYNEYQAEIEVIRKEQMDNFRLVMDARKSGTTLSDTEIEKMMTARFANQGKMLEIEKKYYERFKKVLPMEKVARFYAAEERFKVEMLRELRDRPQAPGRK